MSFPFFTLSIVNIIEKSFSPPKLKRAKLYLRKLYFPSYYLKITITYVENIQKILKFDYQKKSELGLIFIPREALKKTINRLLVKKLKIETHIKYHSQVTPALTALPTAMKKIFNTGKLIGIYFYILREGFKNK